MSTAPAAVIAVSITEFRKFGCPYCGCRDGYVTVATGGTTVWTCSDKQCGRSHCVLAEGVTKSAIGVGGFYPELQPHPLQKMTTQEMQAQVEAWVSEPQHRVKYFPPFEIVAQLVEELGEVAREVAHLHGFKKKKEGEKTDGLEGEIGDILFGLCCLANSHGIDLSHAFQQSLAKKKSRDQNRFSKAE